MTLRRGHGAGAGQPRIEVLPADEQPEGLPGHAHNESPLDRGPTGRFRPGNSLAAIGGAAKRGKALLASRLGLGALPEGHAFQPYKSSAATFRRMQCAELALTVGGGYCGPAPSSLVASAALQLAWSRYLSDKAAITDDCELALKAANLADKSRQNLLAAHELCAREALARPRAPLDPLAAYRLPEANRESER
jgi:hypothetical protein